MMFNRLKLPILALIFCACAHTSSLFAVTPTYVYYGWIEKGNCQVRTQSWTSTTKVQCSYPGAQIDIYTDSAGTIHDTIYSTDTGTALANPFYANSDGSFIFYSNSLVDYVKATGGGLPAAYMRTFYGTTAPTVTYITQAAADLRYLRLIGGALAGPGNLTVGGTLGVTGTSTFTGLTTHNGGVTVNGTTQLNGSVNTTFGLGITGGPVSITRTVATFPGLSVIMNLTGNTTDGIGIDHCVTAGCGSGTTKSWRLGYGWTAAGDDFELYDNSAGTRRIMVSATTGLTSIYNGLTVTGTTTLGTTNAGALSATTGTFSGAVSSTTYTGTGNLTTSANAGIGQAAGSARLVVGAGSASTNAEETRVDSGSGAGGDATYTFYRNGSNKGLLGVSGSANNLITGSAANDLNIRNAQKINWSANGSAAVQMSLNTSGFLGVGSTTGSFPLHVINTATTPQIVAEYDGTHRTGVWHDATNGFVGTTTNTPFRLRTNNTDAVAVDTSQNVNFSARVGINDASATYPFSILKDGTAIGGTFNAIANLRNTAGTKGVYVGYSTVTSNSVIAPTANNSGVTLYSQIGGAWVNSLDISGATGGVVIANGLSVAALDTYGGVACPGGNCIAPMVNKVDQTGKTAAILTTTVHTTEATSRYRVCWSQIITQAATTSSSLQTTIGWTNVSAVKTSTFWQDPSAGTTGTAADATNTLGSERGNCFVSWMLTGTNITYATAYSTTGASVMQYSVWVKVERMF